MTHWSWTPSDGDRPARRPARHILPRDLELVRSIEHSYRSLGLSVWEWCRLCSVSRRQWLLYRSCYHIIPARVVRRMAAAYRAYLIAISGIDGDGGEEASGPDNAPSSASGSVGSGPT